MRIRRLDLLAYGHFTNASFDFPASQPDIHFVYGLNEAGKSISLSAIEDLLFGIPHNSRHNFLHDYASMRVGAAVEGKAGTLEFRRRKGTKDTLLNGDGLPLSAGETALAPYLNGAERAFYERMFCLDHVRLEQGGRGILEAQDDVGQILFSAGVGIAGLREQLRNLHTEADALWGGRHSSRRKYSQAEDRLKQAEATLREHTVTANQWHQLRTALDKSNEACAALDAEIEAKTIESRKLGRIRRVCRNVAKHAELTGKIAALGKAITLPDDAARELDKHLNDDAHAQTRLETLNEQIETLRNERAALNYDEALLARSADIGQLHESRIGVRNGKSDLPKRRAELAAAEADLKKLAAELDWQQDDIGQIIARLPPRFKVADARALSKQHGELIAAEVNARLACVEADERVGSLTGEIDEVGAAADISVLAAAIIVVRGAGDIDARLSATEKDIKTVGDAFAKLIKSLRPTVLEDADIISLPAPQRHVVEHHRDRSRELAQRLQTCRDQIRNVELALNRHRKEYERLASAEHAVPAETLQQLREYRDSGWSIIRRKYVEGVSVPDAEIKAFTSSDSLPGAYEATVLRADEAADQRFESAQATARLTGVARQIAEQQEQLEELLSQEKGYHDDENTLAADWQVLWKPAGISPLSPDDMLGWIDVRSQILQALDRKTAAEQEAASLRDEEVRTRDMLTKELNALGIDTAALSGRPLRMMLELAAETQRQNEGKAASIRKLEDNLKKAKAEVLRKRKALQEAEKKLAAWKDRWSEAITLTGLNPDASIETLDAQIETMDEMRELAGQINNLRRERIEKIERDIVAFEREVTELVASVAPKLVDREAEEAVLELESLLQAATRARELAAAADTKIAAEQEKIEECGRLRRQAADAIARLQNTASVTSVDELREAIRRSDELRSLQSDLQTVVNALSQDGDGMTVVDLTSECEGADLDQVAAREQTINQELEDLRARYMEAGEARSAARRELEAVGSDDRTAKAAADKQAALSEMKDIAEEYVRLRCAELMLQWAVDRYRREKQGPLLKRAGELFSTLTGDSFQDLQVDYDEQDRPELAGIRQDGRKVKVTGMSTGSADQLYLALRVAAVEDFLSHSASLPFIADDLFINFDDERAAAGFRVLAQLAQKTQVLFFTHHQHLLDVARTAIGTSVSTISFSPQVIALDAAAREREEVRASSTGSAATATV
jgi:uncharacterized protein YhaN